MATVIRMPATAVRNAILNILLSIIGIIRPSAYSSLYQVAAFIRQHKKMSVKITAYTNNTGSARVNDSVSQEQANSIAKFLWDSGIDARLLYAEGCGGTNLIAHHSSEWNVSDNYRVEITLEQLSV